jgi:hypothetical protein
MSFAGITMPNVAAFREKLQSDALLGRDWADALKVIVQGIEKRAEDRAPIGKARSIPAAISHVIDSRPVPTYGKVTLAALTKSGKSGKPFRYAGALQGSSRYHYSSGPRKGKTTRRWFSGALAPKAAERLLQAAAERIEARWRRS